MLSTPYRNALRRLTEDFAVSDFDGSYSRFPEKALRVALLASIDDSRYITLRHWARRGSAETWRQSLHDLYQGLNTATASAEPNGKIKSWTSSPAWAAAMINDLRGRRYFRDVTIIDASGSLTCLSRPGRCRR